MFYKWLFLFYFLPGFLFAQETSKSTLYMENGLWGIETNKPITPAVYDTLMPITSTLLYVAKKHKSGTTINNTGVISSKGKIIIPFSYLQIIPVATNYVVKKWEHGTAVFGVVSGTNKTILNTRYKNIQSLGNYWVVQSANNLHLHSADGSIVKQLFADSIAITNNPKYMYTYKAGKVGLIDYSGNELYPPEYKNIYYEHDDWKTNSFHTWKIISNTDTTHLLVDSLAIWDAKTYIIRIGNNYQIEQNNKRLGNFYHAIFVVAPSLAISKKSKQFGAIRKNGEEILPLLYSKMYYQKGHFYAYKNHHWSVYDSLGNKKSVFEYDSIGGINDGLFPIKRKGKWGFMDRNGKEVIHCIYDKAAHFYNGKAIISYYGAMGIINPQGDWVVKPSYKELTDYSFNFYIYKKDLLYYLKNYAGDLIYFSSNSLVFKGETIYEIKANAQIEISSLGIKVLKETQVLEGSSSWQVIKIGGKYGFTNLDGLLKITYRYDSLHPFTEELAAFKLRGKWGFINPNEKIIVQPHFSEVTPFKNGLSIITQKGKKGLINKGGKFILKPKYEAISLLKEGLWLVTQNGLTGIFDAKGNIIIQPKFDNVSYVHDNLIILRRYGTYGAVNSKGVNILPRVYDYIGYDAKNELLLLKKGS